LNHDRLCHRDILDGEKSKKKQRSSSECQEVSIHDATEMQHEFIDNYDTSNVMDDIETSRYSVSAMVCGRILCNGISVGDANFNNFGNYNNLSFFELEHLNGVGLASLVCNASFHVTEGSSHISEQEIKLHLNITRLLCLLTRGQRDDLGTIFGQLTTVLRRTHRGKDNDVLWSTKLPMSPKDIRSLYISGKQAIIPNLAQPSVSSLPNHAYVPLKECIADLLGHGLEFDTIDDSTLPQLVCNISDSWQAKQIFINACNNDVRKLVLYVNEWSDAFEPSRCSKSNRGSCWIKTITVDIKY